eukprot:363910-Chlamydomonas_euryale.AAC.1
MAAGSVGQTKRKRELPGMELMRSRRFKEWSSWEAGGSRNGINGKQEVQGMELMGSRRFKEWN